MTTNLTNRRQAMTDARQRHPASQRTFGDGMTHAEALGHLRANRATLTREIAGLKRDLARLSAQLDQRSEQLVDVEWAIGLLDD